MVPEDWLDPSLVLPALAVTSVEELVQAAAKAFAAAAGIDRAPVEAGLLQAIREDGFSVGRGVAIPHIELPGLTATRVCVVILASALGGPTLDGRAIDIVFVILSKPDPQAHLLLLAHLARLTQSRTLLDGLRRAQSPAEVVALIRAAELRHTALRAADVAVAPYELILVSISGERAVDALLIDLVDQGLGDACVLDAQSLREAAAREVPLFAGFRDLFGDPGGRRMLIVQTPAAGANTVLEAVQRVCDECDARDALVSVIPVQARWILSRGPKDEPAGGGGHG